MAETYWERNLLIVREKKIKNNGWHSLLQERAPQNLINFLYVLQEAGEVTSKYAGSVQYIAFWGIV